MGGGWRLANVAQITLIYQFLLICDHFDLDVALEIKLRSLCCMVAGYGVTVII